MFKTAGRYSQILTYVTVALMLVLFLLQFLPFYSSADGSDVVSMQGYVWWPLEHKDVTKVFTDAYGRDWDAAQMVLMPVLVLVCACVGAFFELKNPKKLWPCTFPLIGSGSAVFFYLTNPIYQMNGIWVLQFAVAVLALATTIANIAMRPWKDIFGYFRYG